MAKCCNFGDCSTITQNIHFFDHVLHRSRRDCLLKKCFSYKQSTKLLADQPGRTLLLRREKEGLEADLLQMDRAGWSFYRKDYFRIL